MWEMDEFACEMRLGRFNGLRNIYPFCPDDARLEPTPRASSRRPESGRSQALLVLATAFLGVGASVSVSALYFLL